MERSRRTAQYFATLTPTEDYRIRWEKFLSIIEGEIALKEAKARAIAEVAKKATGEDLVELREELSALKLSLDQPAGSGELLNNIMEMYLEMHHQGQAICWSVLLISTLSFTYITHSFRQGR